MEELPFGAFGDAYLSPDNCFEFMETDGRVEVWALDWDLEARVMADWDEGARPELRTHDSPTWRVGAEVGESHLAKHRHLAPMASLGNAMSDAELEAWEEKAIRLVGDAVRLGGYTVELKIDGAAVSLTYRDGVRA